MDNTKNNISLTLKPEDLQENFHSIPKMESPKKPDFSQEYNAGSTSESMLSAEERETVEQFSKEIDISDFQQIRRYGSSAQKNISDFSVSILNKVKTRDLGEVGETLKELTVTLDAVAEPKKTGLRGLFQKAKQGVDTVRANYAKAETNIQKIENDLMQHQIVLNQDVSMLEQMYQLNMSYYKELTMYIIAGKKALDRAVNSKLAELKMTAEATKSPEDIQFYQDYESFCNRFDRKLHDLEITRMIAIQTAPQVRMLQNTNEEMLEKIESSIANTIPLWRNQMVIALGIEHNQRAISAQTAVSETTQRLLLQNAQALKMSTTEAARESERSVVDISTIRQCNQQLIASINEVVRIHEEGSKKRKEAEVELIKIEEELKQALLQAGSR